MGIAIAAVLAGYAIAIKLGDFQDEYDDQIR
jgi:hypothetical protein